MAIHICTIRDGKIVEDAVMTDALAWCSSSVSHQASRSWQSSEAAMARNQIVSSILDKATAAIGGWTALQSIKCVHLDSEGQDCEPWQEP
jgi:hypothetical protein